ncbi:endonuclease [Aureimonas sp. SA4125]|uniref:endonuclease/exonuclease/phosphatase family protein n=1 Tax=Aureimonas sp. SA4125 TaxID=2826993 RepID=UPI001CC3B3EF|nr:endonuclease/exonuclease/phosphatase family protein [Aureimonas sp. SA4125]BDA85255.1 endonuclease [Aureimonas sp. SA4125]
MPLRQLIRLSVAELAVPSPSVLAEAERVENSIAEHHRLAARVSAFGAIEQRQAEGASKRGGFRAAAWNAERLKFHAASVAMLTEVDADVIFLTEADLGMARSGNRHTTAELAEALGMGYAYGVEFLELGLGDAREEAECAGRTNAVGFHGNALLSRMKLADPFLVRLDDGAIWFLGAEKGQRRLGWRMAIGGRIETSGGPVLVVSVHLESKTDPADRAAQVKRLLGHLETLSAGMPVVIGGDFNTKPLFCEDTGWFDDPSALEPLFSLMGEAGFEWRTANRPEITTRTRPDGDPKPPHKRLDWLFVRGLAAAHPATVAAVDAEGKAISDHDLVVADFGR